MTNNLPLPCKIFFCFCLAIALLSFSKPLTIKVGAASRDGAARPAKSAQTEQGLQSALRQDGTIRPDVSGSFSAKGFRFQLGANGEPRFLSSPSAVCSDNWDNRFSLPGATGAIYAVATDGNGNVYVGGNFTTMGSVPAHHIAMWNGTKWTVLGDESSPEGNGVSVGTSAAGGGTVNAILVDGNNIYVGGIFDYVNNGAGEHIPASSIAVWNGTSWASIGGVANTATSRPTVYALEKLGNDIYAGGSFTQAYNPNSTVLINTNRVAKWNGSVWSGLGNGNTSVTNGVNGEVFAFTTIGTDLYIGGAFTTAYNGATSLTANRLVKWDGANWSILGANATATGNGLNNTVNALASIGNTLYAGGVFNTAYNSSLVSVPANRIARFDGAAWSPLGGGANSTVYTLLVRETQLYVGGSFTTVGNGTTLPASRVAVWNGNVWSTLGSGASATLNGVDSDVRGLAFSNNNLYVGGQMTIGQNADSTLAGYRGIVAWNGTNWFTMSDPAINGLGVDGTINAIAVNGTDVYIGGSFRKVGNVNANNLARWNGTAWLPLGTGASTTGNGVNNTVNTLAAQGNSLYVGGDFTSAFNGTVTVAATRVARWNGTTWSTLGTGNSASGNGANNTVSAILVNGNDVYVGGNFTTVYNAQGVSLSANRIAKWNGSNWAALGLGTTATGNGVDAPVYALALLGGELYIGGVFTNAYNDVGSGVPANRVARWNGSNWSVLGGGMVSNGNGVSNAVYALAVNGPSLYVGGAFTSAYNNVGSNVACKNMAVWNGSGWAALGNVPGTGVAAVSAASASAVRNLMFLGNNLYVGGYFAYAHGTSGPPISISNVAVWDGTNWGALGQGAGPIFGAQANQVLGMANADGKIYVGGQFKTTGCRVAHAFGIYTAYSGQSLSIGDAAVTEGNSGTVNATFTVSLSSAAAQPVTISYATANSTATAGSDYQAVTNGTVTFNPGETSKTVQITVMGDTLAEFDETFVVSLTSANGATIADADGLGTITNDDGTPPAIIGFETQTVNVGEGGGSAVVRIGRVNNTNIVSTVDYEVASDTNYVQCNVTAPTASSRCDYIPVQGRLSFAPGEISKTISIPIVDDYFAEGSESFTLALGNPNNAILSPQTAATVTINDNDTAQPSGNRMFVAQLTGTQIVPANTSTATGTGILTLNEAETQATVSLNFSGLTGTQSAARIHGPAHTGVNGSTAFTLTTGAVNNANINLTPVQVQQLKAGLFYFMITTSGFSSGEIRGQILPNPAESARFFVRQQYYDFLNREPDTAGLNYWAGQITATGTNLTNLRDRRIGVSNAFFFELEFQQTGAYVYRLYRAAFGNNQPFPNPENHPDAAKIPSYQVFVSDRSRVVGGAQLAQAQLAVAQDITTLSEFTSRYPASQTAAQFVDALLGTIQAATGANLSSQRDALITLHGSGGRAAVLYRLADDNATNPINNRAFLDAEYNRSFVITQYFGYLRRDPDIGGFNFWLDIVNRYPLRSASGQSAMVCAFVTSEEYQLRFGPVASRANAECPPAP